MKTSLYSKYRKNGIAHFVNKKLLGLKNPDNETVLFYLILIVGIICISYLL